VTVHPFDRTATAIAGHLPGTWHIQPRVADTWIRLADTAGRRITIWHDSPLHATGRVVVRGHFDDDDLSNDVRGWIVPVGGRPEMGASANRDPKAIAADIVRRILHVYDDLAAQVSAAVADGLSNRDHTAAVSERIAAAFGTGAELGKTGVVYWTRPGDASINVVRYSSLRGVGMDLHNLSPETAEKIAALVAADPGVAGPE
jgi:hypothetical protein